MTSERIGPDDREILEFLRALADYGFLGSHQGDPIVAAHIEKCHKAIALIERLLGQAVSG